MALKIVRNDITKMTTDAIVNTANEQVAVGPGCDYAVYEAAGFDKLMRYRETNIGIVAEGEAFITPGFDLSAKYIIHAVAPLYKEGLQGEEKKLRSCYKNSLKLAKKNEIRSISFPLISTGGYGYPKEEGMRIAVDEINAFLLEYDMDIYLVVFGDKATELGMKIYPDLETYIDQNYVREKMEEEYGGNEYEERSAGRCFDEIVSFDISQRLESRPARKLCAPKRIKSAKPREIEVVDECLEAVEFEEEHENRLEERIKHRSDTFSQYLMYLIKEKKLKNAEVYKRAIVDKKIFSKIKNNPDYHPQKMTALCLCVGARLNLDEAKDLLARAGYALSPCDKTDIIFSYFIENEIYDMIELDIQLEEHGLPCIIS
ncbi:MAG: macro domain-containing protein [Selenomonadaceae bacterium]|nr:macro domain-containing protein [Selenomonadaceae bacterium]